jgi:structural maintenance of chromosome 1
MGRISQIELENFKSYKGKHTIHFSAFTSIIGPNGAGKSNLMDAISFVLGIKTTQLRSNQLKELIYHDGTVEFDSAHVTAVYESEDQSMRFTRSVLPSGSSEYRIDNKQVTFAKYVAVLEKQNILVKARNFLVFQGDVEQVASQSPKDLTHLIEQISGSLELKAEYDRLKALQETATESTALNFNKKKTIHAEMKQFKEQKVEAERYDRLKMKRVKTVHLG